MTDKKPFFELPTEAAPSFNYSEEYKKSFVDITKPMAAPPVVLSIGTHEYKGQTYANPTFTAGEMSAIIAPQKSKKSFFKRALAASYIGGGSTNYFPSITTKRRTGDEKIVLDFDTEQGKYYAHRSFAGVIEMVGSTYKNYLPFGIKHMSDSEMLQFIDVVIQQYRGQIGMVFIDGIADLCFNPNDIEQSQKVIQKLKEWTEYGIHVCCVIHKTFDKDKAFGHLGTYVQKKVETSIFLQTTDAMNRNAPIEIWQKDSRGAPFETFYFDLDESTVIPQECEPPKNIVEY